jgi:hypothetical protein
LFCFLADSSQSPKIIRPWESEPSLPPTPPFVFGGSPLPLPYLLPPPPAYLLPYYFLPQIPYQVQAPPAPQEQTPYVAKMRRGTTKVRREQRRAAEERTNSFKAGALETLTEWYAARPADAMPTPAEAERLAAATGLSVRQVYVWIHNKHALLY